MNSLIQDILNILAKILNIFDILNILAKQTEIHFSVVPFSLFIVSIKGNNTYEIFT